MDNKSVCIILTDPLKSFVKKGEIKPNYYNPGDFFDKIYFISFSHSDVDNDSAKILSANADVRIYPLGKINILTLLPIFIRALFLIKKIRPALIRAYDPSARGLFSVIIGRLLGIPVVISIHAELDEQRKCDNRFKLKFRRLLEYHSIRLADTVICVTNHVREYAQRFGALNNHTKVIYNGVDLVQFAHPSTQQIFRKDTILCVGRLDKQKYQECLIKAVSLLDTDMDLALIGDGPEFNRLVQLSRELNIAQKVHFIRSVPHNKIQDYYCSAKIFAIATHYEGFCIPVIEAMASGVPVVASCIPPIREIIGDAGLLADNSPESFRSNIELLLKDNKMYDTFVEKGKHRVRMFDNAVIEQEHKKIYAALIARYEMMK